MGAQARATQQQGHTDQGPAPHLADSTLTAFTKVFRRCVCRAIIGIKWVKGAVGRQDSIHGNTGQSRVSNNGTTRGSRDRNMGRHA